MTTTPAAACQCSCGCESRIVVGRVDPDPLREWRLCRSCYWEATHPKPVSIHAAPHQREYTEARAIARLLAAARRVELPSLAPGQYLSADAWVEVVEGTELSDGYRPDLDDVLNAIAELRAAEAQPAGRELQRE